MKTTKNLLLSFALFALSSLFVMGGEPQKSVQAEPCEETQSTETTPSQTIGNDPKPSSFRSGFVLTRVELSGKDSLVPFAKSSDKDYASQKKEFAGLVVFHLGNKGSKMPAGAYVWDGDKWQRMSVEQ